MRPGLPFATGEGCGKNVFAVEDANGSKGITKLGCRFDIVPVEALVALGDHPGLLTLSVCPPARSNPTSCEASTTGAPTRGGRLRIAQPIALAVGTIDAASFLSPDEYLGAFCNRLIKLDEQGVTVPDLAGSKYP